MSTRSPNSRSSVARKDDTAALNGATSRPNGSRMRTRLGLAAEAQRVTRASSSGPRHAGHHRIMSGDFVTNSRLQTTEWMGGWRARTRRDEAEREPRTVWLLIVAVLAD